MKPFFLFLFLQITSAAIAQEFPKNEFISHLRLHNGMVTTFKGSAPDAYVGGIQLVPQYTLAENLLRGGIVVDAFYQGKKLQAVAGPTVSLKLKSFNAGFFGTGGNVHVNIDHLWGTEKQRLLGGGINFDVGNRIVISGLLHRDYKWKTWWLQSGIALRLSKVKQIPHP